MVLQSHGLARRSTSPAWPAYPFDQGYAGLSPRWRPRPIAVSECSMTRRRNLILSILTAGCWIVLLAIVLRQAITGHMTTKSRHRGVRTVREGLSKHIYNRDGAL